MNAILKKKLNLLVHLARIDGDFHKSEREMIFNLVNDMQAIDAVPRNADPFAGIEGSEDREEIFYLALKLVLADSKLTEDELKFCRTLATKLGFRDGAADRFAKTPLPDFAEFTKEVKHWCVNVR
jgi:hypothetical protein